MTIKKVTNKKSKHYGEFRVRVQPMINGKIISVPVAYASSKSKANRLETALIDQAKSGYDFSQDKLLLSEALSIWIEKQVKMDRWGSATEHAWRFTLKMVRHYCESVKLRECSEDDIREFIQRYVKEHHATVSTHSTAAKMLQQLRTYFLSMEGTGISKSPVPKRPLDYFFRRDRQSIVKDKYVLTDEELRKFKSHIKKEIRALPVQNTVTRLALWVESETGMRPQEIQALRFGNLINEEKHWTFKINDSYSEITSSMNGHLKSRKIGEYRLTPPISFELYDEINTFQVKQASFLKEKGLSNSNDLIFLSLSDYRLARLGKPITQRSMNDMLKQICKKIDVQNNDLPLTCYTLRTTTGTRLARLGDYSYASSRLGNSLSVYERYYVKPLNRGYGKLMDEYLKM